MTAEERPVDLPLHGVRVLECGDTLAAAYAGRLLCDLGAEVVKLEGPAGDPLRAVGPFLGGVPNRDLSASFGYFNAGKRSVVIGDDEVAAGLAREADVVVRCTRAGDDWVSDQVLAEVSALSPGLIVADISTFGRLAGDHEEGEGAHPMSDLLALAAGGLLSVNASSPTDPAASPLRYRGELASVHAACDAVIAILGALFVRRRTGLGQRLDVSAQAAVASILATGVARFAYTGEVPVRDGTRSVAPWGFYHCSDGMVLIQCTEDQEWRRLLVLLGSPEWGEMEIFETTAQRELVTDVLDHFVNEALASYTVAEFVAAAYAHRVPAAPIHSAADILGWEHLAARQFWRRLGLSDGRREAVVAVPGVAWRYRTSAGTPVPVEAAPRWGEATPGAGTLWARRPPTEVDAEEVERGRSAAPLAGVRVIDLTWVWAGPFAAMQLAHLGAEVIKVESAGRIDVTRRLGPHADGVVGVNRSGYFNQYNQGKKSVTLNLKDPRGLTILRGLLATADVVIDNMSAGALERMGLPYEALRELNPRIVAVSMTGFGESGPERDRMAYGSLIDALSGAAAANGLVGGGPTDFPMSLPDPAAGIHTAIATVAALYRAQRSGVGERVECSMLEANVAAFPWPVLFASVAGSESPVVGNRDDLRSPHDVYRCGGGGDRWVAVAVESDAQFAALGRAIGHPGLADEPRFATLAARRLHENDLDGILGAWAATRHQDEAVAVLQAAGVPAEAVAGVDDLFGSKVLLERDFFTRADHPELGVRLLAGVAWQPSLSPMVAATAAPRLGAHTRTVLAAILGLDGGELDALEVAGVLR